MFRAEIPTKAASALRLCVKATSVEVPSAWEKESRGQKPKSLKKVSKKSPGAGSQKSEKSLEKGRKSQKKSLKMGFWRLFGPFSRLFSDFWDPAPGDFFRDFFETFSRLF